MPEEIFEEISTSFSNLENSGKIQNLVRKALSDGTPALEILEKGMRVGLDKVGQKYEACEYFLSELLYAATIMNEVMDILKPELEKVIQEEKGKIVLGTVRGDIHDIGKNIFKMLAISSGFTVIDLGVDVESEKFITTIKEMKASEGPQMLIVKVNKGARKDLGRPTTTPIENKEGFMGFLKG